MGSVFEVGTSSLKILPSTFQRKFPLRESLVGSYEYKENVSKSRYMVLYYASSGYQNVWNCMVELINWAQSYIENYWTFSKFAYGFESKTEAKAAYDHQFKSRRKVTLFFIFIQKRLTYNMYLR